jgi:hypothetical protein
MQHNADLQFRTMLEINYLFHQKCVYGNEYHQESKHPYHFWISFPKLVIKYYGFILTYWLSKMQIINVKCSRYTFKLTILVKYLMKCIQNNKIIKRPSFWVIYIIHKCTLWKKCRYRCGKLTSFFELSGLKRRGAPGGWAWSRTREGILKLCDVVVQ